MSNLDLDREENGKPLPTLKNIEIVRSLEKKLGGEKMMEDYQKDFLEYCKWVLFDPRNKRNLVVYRTAKQAAMAKQYWDRIDELDKEYIEKQRR